MTVFEILLVIIGFILFGGSFFISEKITATKEQLKVAIDENEVKKLIKSQVKNMNEEIVETVNESIENSTDGVKRAMEKLSNEKIMAINEYSDTVMEAIHKNHNEVMFLYGMLNDKNKEIKDTAELITKANKGINKKISEAQTVIDKMNIQISSMKHYFEIQSENMDKIEKSTSAIEILEEEIKNIEQMALQFSKEMKESEDKFKKQHLDFTEENNSNHPNEDISEEFNLEVNETLEYEEKIDEDSEDSKDDMEVLLENFSNDIDDIEPDDENVIKDASYYNNKILDMSESGYSTLEIAKTLGLGVGEVQLVIDLSKGGRR